MKKIVLALAVVFSVALVSCGNKQAAAEDTATVEEEVNAVVANDNDSDSNKVEVTEITEGAIVEEAPAEATPTEESK